MAARPIRLGNPFITLGTDDAVAVPPTTAEDMSCYCSGIHLTAEDDDTAATFCDPMGVKWVLSLDLKMSLGTDSLDEAWQSLGAIGTVIPFEFAYSPDVASAANPHWTGEVRLPALSIVDAGINEVTEITVDMDVIGDISRDVGTGAFAVTATHTHDATVAA